jgi:hypothetical protein
MHLRLRSSSVSNGAKRQLGRLKMGCSMCAIGHPVCRTILETLNVNSRKAQWAYMRDTIAMIT